MSPKSKQKTPRSRSHTPSRSQRARGSDRSSESVQKTEILINVYDLLPVRLPILYFYSPPHADPTE